MKLPKEIQKKESNKPKRPQAVRKREGQNQFGSRQMRRRMQNQGIDMEPIEAQRVIIENKEKTLVIEDPEVVLMKQAGQEIYQVIGNAEEYAPGEFAIREGDLEEELDVISNTDESPTITEKDVIFVASQTNVSPEEARTILVECEGDIAKAIIFIKNRG
ncbi:MAG: nascent polypeptide-associated complex protein [Promethearchaeota archaeon]